jgi:hypothetical protein
MIPNNAHQRVYFLYLTFLYYAPFIGTNKIYIPAVQFFRHLTLNFRNRKSTISQGIFLQEEHVLYLQSFFTTIRDRERMNADVRMFGYYMRGARTDKFAL